MFNIEEVSDELVAYPQHWYQIKTSSSHIKIHLILGVTNKEIKTKTQQFYGFSVL